MKPVMQAGTRLTRNQMKLIGGGEGGCCAYAYSEGMTDPTTVICGLSRAEAQDQALVYAMGWDPTSSDSGSGGRWCCASCAGNV